MHQGALLPSSPVASSDPAPLTPPRAAPGAAAWYGEEAQARTLRTVQAHLDRRHCPRHGPVPRGCATPRQTHRAKSSPGGPSRTRAAWCRFPAVSTQARPRRAPSILVARQRGTHRRAVLAEIVVARAVPPADRRSANRARGPLAVLVEPVSPDRGVAPWRHRGLRYFSAPRGLLCGWVNSAPSRRAMP